MGDRDAIKIPLEDPVAGRPERLTVTDHELDEAGHTELSVIILDFLPVESHPERFRWRVVEAEIGEYQGPARRVEEYDLTEGRHPFDQGLLQVLFP